MIKYIKNKITKIIYILIGAELVDIIRRENKYRKKRKTGEFARYGIDRTIESLMPYNSGFYVELGANDGALASNTYFFELKKNWRGVLIEPSPNLFLSCLKRRGDKNKVYCNACVSFDYDPELVKMSYADSMTISEDLKLDIGDKKDFLESSKKHLRTGEDVFQFGAIAKTLDSILDDANAPCIIDFLSLDVEGAELEVLKGINYQKFNFKYIVVESRDINLLMNFLKSKGYKLKKKLTHHDYLIEYIE